MSQKKRPEKSADMVIGCLSNNADILSANLMLSPAVRSGALKLVVEKNPTSAATGYNRILDRTDAPIVILAHHDVFLPDGWEQLLARRIAEVEAVDPDWGIIAPYGIDEHGTGWGPVWSSSIGQVVGRVATEPVAIKSSDELLIVLRRHEGLRFDEGMAHFHFYGLDIVQTAWALGHGAWNVPLPLVHNDRFKGDLGEDYAQGYHFVRKKWRAQLPLHSPTAKVSWHGLHLRGVRKRMRESVEHRKAIAVAAEVDPRIHAERCGWETLGGVPAPAIRPALAS